MEITFSPEVQEFLQAQVEAGNFPTIDAVVNACIAALKESRTATLDKATLDVIDQAEAEYEAGHGRPWAEVRAELEREWGKPVDQRP